MLHQPEARHHAGGRARAGDGDQAGDGGRPRRGQGGAQGAQRALRLRHHPGRRAGAEIHRGRRVTPQSRAACCPAGNSTAAAGYSIWDGCYFRIVRAMPVCRDQTHSDVIYSGLRTQNCVGSGSLSCNCAI